MKFDQYGKSANSSPEALCPIPDSSSDDRLASTSNPAVSVIIPTRNRPGLLLKAVASVLSQTLQTIEVIVVIDGPDPLTQDALKGVLDKRVRVLPLTESVGGSEARNIGMLAAAGKWIALLDDDDEFMAEKLEKQLRTASTKSEAYPILHTRYIINLNKGERIYPRRPQAPGEPLSEYLICRHRLRAGEGAVSTSTLFFPKTLIEKHPFTKGLRQHQDGDWLLRVNEIPGVSLTLMNEVLGRTNGLTSRNRVSANSRWQESLQWARDNRSRVTDKAFAAWISGICMPKVIDAGEGFETQLKLFYISFKEGMPTLASLIVFFRYFLLGIGRQLRELLSKKRN